MANPHLHLQQNGATLLQQLQLLSLALSRFCLYEDLFAESVIFCLFFQFFSHSLLRPLNHQTYLIELMPNFKFFKIIQHGLLMLHSVLLEPLNP